MARRSETRSARRGDREALAFRVLSIAAFAIIAAAGTLVFAAFYYPDFSSEDRTRILQGVFNAVLPVMAAWGGSVLTFYFSRENFDAAQNSIEAVVRGLSAEDRANLILAEAAMIKRAEIFDVVVGQHQTVGRLMEIRDRHQRSRMPIFNADGTVYGVVHASLLFEFLHARPHGDQRPDAEIPLQELLDHPRFGEIIRHVATIGPKATILEVKRKLDEDRAVQDIFVTANGAADGVVKGWLTNIDVADFLRPAAS